MLHRVVLMMARQQTARNPCRKLYEPPIIRRQIRCMNQTQLRGHVHQSNDSKTAILHCSFLNFYQENRFCSEVCRNWCNVAKNSLRKAKIRGLFFYTLLLKFLISLPRKPFQFRHLSELGKLSWEEIEYSVVSNFTAQKPFQFRRLSELGKLSWEEIEYSVFSNFTAQKTVQFRHLSELGKLSWEEIEYSVVSNFTAQKTVQFPTFVRTRET